MYKFTVTHSNVPFDVEYAVERGYPATREEPGLPDSLVEVNVYIDEHDVTDVLCAAVLEAIEDACWADLEQRSAEYDPAYD